MLFTTPEALAHLAAPWAKFYSHSKPAATVVTFLHIAPLLVGGGVAIALDRAALLLRHDEPGERERHLRDLAGVHRLVLSALTVSLLSGLALLAADLDTFLGSWIFWLKMGLVAALMLNGFLMTRLEEKLNAPSASMEHWGRLRSISITSLTLWIIITFVGVVLTNAS